MKRLALILGMLLFVTNAQAEEKEFEIYYDENKTTSDEVIASYYKQLEFIPQLEAKCKDTMEWGEGSFSLLENLYIRLITCLTWETNKKLNIEQIELLTRLNKAWSDAIIYLYQGDGIFYKGSTTFYLGNEYLLQLAVRIYNIVMNKKWPECVYETGNYKDEDYFQVNQPCNVESSVLQKCQQDKDIISCMQTELKQKYLELITELHKDRAPKNMTNLLSLTEEVIKEIEPDKEKQKKEIIRLYNFYWLSIENTYEYEMYFQNAE